MVTEIRYRIMKSPQDYCEMLELQEKTRDEVVKGFHDGMIYFLEHLPVYTSGLRGTDNQFLRPLEGVPVYKIKRGGELTWHGPGQLVIYPVINFRKTELVSIREFVNYFGEAISRVLDDHCGIKSAKWDEKRAGIWVEDRKIAFSGLHFRKFVPVHGYSVNLSCDTRYFQSIIPCGIPDCKITSVKSETGVDHTVEGISTKIVEILKEKMPGLTHFQEDI
jgi:lipoyl(octanoyl) transferase